MRATRVVVMAGLTMMAVVLGTSRFRAAHASVARNVVGDATFTDREVARLRAHFDSVDIELRRATPSSLSSAQRARRDTMIAWLRVYRDAGVFPQNDRFATPTPFFVDHRGVRCAMGELLHLAGRDDIVRDVQRSRNNAYIAELADDPRLVAWLDSVGMTVAEAGRVQPTYDDFPGIIVDDVGRPTTPRDRAVAVALSGASLAMVGLNVRRPTGWSKWAGLAVGTAGVITGSRVLSEDKRRNDGLVVASVVTGAASIALSAFRVFQPARKDGGAAGGGRVGSLALQPAMVRVSDGHVRPGLALHATFR